MMLYAICDNDMVMAYSICVCLISCRNYCGHTKVAGLSGCKQCQNSMLFICVYVSNVRLELVS